MSHRHRLDSLSDDELLERLTALVGRHRRLDAEVVAHIAEVDLRKLYLGQACSSMFAYATELLHLSEAEAYLRIAVARASRRFPELLAMLGDGRLHLSGIARLAPHLDADNFAAVTGRAQHMSKREIDKLVAELSPRPDIPARIRKLPARVVASASSDQLRPERVEGSGPAQVVAEGAPLVPRMAPAPPPIVPTRPARLEPIAPSRYKVEFTASAELHDKLTRAQALLRHRDPDSSGDLSEVVDEAVTLLLARLEARKFAKTKAPRKTVAQSDTSASSRTIPAAIKRAVFARDEGRCAFVATSGRRCSCSDPGQLEYHHVHPYALGGDHSLETIELRCRAHNAYQAELDYGKEAMRLARTSSRKGATRASEPAPTTRWQADGSRPEREWPGQARAGDGGPTKARARARPFALALGGVGHSRHGSGRGPLVTRQTRSQRLKYPRVDFSED